MVNPTEKELIQMARDFDEFVLDFCKENCMSPFATTGLILARLTNMAQNFGYSKDYTNLLSQITHINETLQDGHSPYTQ